MKETVPSALGIIAGKGAYPWLLADSARKQGVSRIVAVDMESALSMVDA